MSSSMYNKVSFLGLFLAPDIMSLGFCYHQNLTGSEVGRDQDGLEEYTWKKYVNRPDMQSLG